MPLIVKNDEAFNPIDIRLFRSQRIVLEAEDTPHLIEQFLACCPEESLTDCPKSRVRPSPAGQAQNKRIIPEENEEFSEDRKTTPDYTPKHRWIRPYFWELLLARRCYPYLMHDASNCPVCSTSPTSSSMSDEQFSAFVAACRDELAHLQPRFQQRILGSDQWHYDLADCTLRIGDHSFPITPIGTHSPERHSWLWAWANEDFPLRAREASKSLQSLQNLTGFRVFTSPGIAASDSDAQVFSALAVRCLRAIGIFRVPGAPTLFLAVHEPPKSDPCNA
ncbi:MAG: hypothetical protein QM796_09320 [Chthoniobacteraceae bacterium]